MTRRQKPFGARPEAAAERVAGGGLLHRRTLLKLERWRRGDRGRARRHRGRANGISGGPAMDAGAGSSHERLRAAVEVRGARPAQRLAALRRYGACVGRVFHPTRAARGDDHAQRASLRAPSQRYIDPAAHRLAIHGLVRQPLVFSVDDLLRYPMTTYTRFIECSGNSLFNAFPSRGRCRPG